MIKKQKNNVSRRENIEKDHKLKATFNKIKEELGNKKYSQLKTNGELKKLEKNLLNKRTTIYQLLE